MNTIRFITLFATITLISGCLGSAITIKDATGFIAGQVISNATDSDTVIVKDARIKRNNVTQITPTTKNWNSTAVPTTDTNPTTNPTTKPTQIQHVAEDKTTTLYWFFFSMMIMGMLGAGIIGIIEAFSGRNSLSTEQAVRTAPIQKVKIEPLPANKPKPRVKLNKDGTTKDV
jgi:hypothetical protein